MAHKKEEVFQSDSSSEEEEEVEQDQALGQQEEEDDDGVEPEEGEIVSASEQGEIVSKDENNQLPDGSQREELYDSSSENEARLQTEKRKRELWLRQREAEEEKIAGFSAQELLRKALQDLERTNKRVMVMRKKNLKRMEDIEKVRMTQQPYLTATNTPFRGSIGEYPLLTTDRSAHTLYHPNYSLRLHEMRLADFIQKNIKEEATSNYLNEVVKFENYAYQQRKKRRQHIE